MSVSITPSEVVAFMEAQSDLPFLAVGNSGRNVSVERNHLALVSALLRLVDAVPSELVALSGPKLAAYIAAVEQVRVAVRAWQADSRSSFKLQNPPARQGDPHPLKVVQEALRCCPDETGPSDGTRFAFIENDPELQADLDRDLSNVEAALLRRDWKAATVVGGATIEALLLWALNQEEATTAGTIDRVRAAAALPNHAPERWDLSHLISAGRELGLLQVNNDHDDVAALGQVRRYRNLIHPGRAQRLAFRCGKDTAHFALAGIHLVCRRILDRQPTVEEG